MQKEELNFTTQLRKGLMEYCILLILYGGKAYPSDINAKLKENGMEAKEATIYTVLSRLSKEGKVDYQWQESTQGPPRKYFTLTPYGRHCANAMGNVWGEMTHTVNSLIASIDNFEKI